MPWLNLRQTAHSQSNYRATGDFRAGFINTTRANKHSLTQEITDRLGNSFVGHDRGALIAENNVVLKALCARHQVDVR